MEKMLLAKSISGKKSFSPKVDFFMTQKGIKLIKDTFERKLAEKLSLLYVKAPRFIKVGKGLQDDLAGTQEPVSFKMKSGEDVIEFVHSLAKWKRYMLGKHSFKPGTGIYTDMDAIRKDEKVDEIHSIYVDQWDWEQVIIKGQRTLEFLKETVRRIYGAILETKKIVEKEFPGLKVRLPDDITFIHAEELEEIYPDLTPREREDAIAKEHRAVFLIGIGHPLKQGLPHDLRAADYDDWFTKTSGKTRGLNGDIIVWDEVRKKSLELSSMGIRVDAKTLLRQLELKGLTDRKTLEFHSGVIEGKIPLTIGGGIGQSRLCMFLLQKVHIGEVHYSVWPEDVIVGCEDRGIPLLL